MIVVTFQCGHSQQANGSESELACAQCSERGIANVEAPAPRFRGTVLGPHAEYAALEAKAVTFGEKNNA